MIMNDTTQVRFSNFGSLSANITPKLINRARDFKPNDISAPFLIVNMQLSKVKVSKPFGICCFKLTSRLFCSIFLRRRPLPKVANISAITPIKLNIDFTNIVSY